MAKWIYITFLCLWVPVLCALKPPNDGSMERCGRIFGPLPSDPELEVLSAVRQASAVSALEAVMDVAPESGRFDLPGQMEEGAGRMSPQMSQVLNLLGEIQRQVGEVQSQMNAGQRRINERMTYGF